MMDKFGEVLENVDLKKYNTYSIGGIAKYLIYPFDSDSLVNLLKYLNDSNIKFFILGNGSNIILPDKYFDGVIIKLDSLNNITIENDLLIAETGINLNALINKSIDLGYVSLYKLAGIPGTLGGATIQNAGCLGVEIFDYIVDVTILDENYKIKVLKKEDINYSYRYTEFKKSKPIILKCSLKLDKGNTLDIKKLMKDNLNERIKKQPLEYKNAGSVFKNPEGLSAGKLIEECGLKGYTIGGAKVSNKHANFIINFNSASSNDIINLINKIKEVVKEKKGIDLELEQEIINW